MFDGLHLKRPARLQRVNDLEGHSMSSPLLPFDRQHTISHLSSIVSVSLFCTVFEILSLICLKVKTSRDLDHAHLVYSGRQIEVCIHVMNTWLKFLSSDATFLIPAKMRAKGDNHFHKCWHSTFKSCMSVAIVGVV